MGGLIRAVLVLLAAVLVLTTSTCTAFQSNHHATRDTTLRRATTPSRQHLWIPTTKRCALASASPLFGNQQRNKRQPRRAASFHLWSDRFTAGLVPKQWLWNPKLFDAIRKRQRNWKRRWTTVVVAVLFWCTATFLVIPPPPAHASSSSSVTASRPPVTERLLQHTSPKVDDLIDRYVRQHMFDDDYSDADPVASTYREAYTDATTGRYPAALREVTAQVWQGRDKALAGTAAADEGNNALNIGRLLTAAVQTLQTKVGLSETTALFVLAGTFVVAGPSAFLLGGMIVGGISKRNMNRLFQKRYGEDYTVDATVKKEEMVEAPDDEEDDDEDEDDDDDDDDDEPDDKK